MQTKINLFIMVEEYHLMEKVCGVLVMALLEVIIFGADNTSSSHTDNQKNNFLILRDGAFEGINFSKAKTKFCLSLHYNGDDSYVYVNKTEICKSKANDNISWFNFCLGSMSKDFTKDELSEVLNRIVNDFSVDHNSVKSD